MADYLEYVKGFSPLGAIIIVIFTYFVLRKLRSDQKDDVHDIVRFVLGLQNDERFSDKLDDAISRGFSSAVHPLTESISHLSATIGALSNEVKGLREGLTNHGEKINELDRRVAVLERIKQ